jgi:hypothetical protein
VAPWPRLDAQNAVVVHEVNFRRDPSTSGRPIRVFAIGDSLHVLEPDTVRGFLAVAARDSVEGWVWAKNVELVVEPQPAGVAAAPPAPTAAAAHKACDLDGDAKGEHDKASNRLKNRVDPPGNTEIDSDATLKEILKKGPDGDRWTETLGAEIVGYVIAVKPGGEETVNCHSPFDNDYDTHIELALTTNASKIRRMVIEITPRIRAKAAANGDDWSTDALQAAILHKCEAYAAHVYAARREYNRRYAHPFEWTWTSQQMRRWYTDHVTH